MTALNREALLKKLNQLRDSDKKKAKGNEAQAKNTFKPTEGENRVRIIALKGTDGIPFKELKFHYNIAGQTVLSPLSYGEKDPIQEYALAMLNKAKNNRLPTDQWKALKDLEAQTRTYALVLVRGKEDEGLKWWGFGKKVYEQLAAAMLDSDAGDVVDPVNGRDIVVVFTPKEKSSTGFSQTLTRLAIATSPISSNSVLVEKLLKNIPELENTYQSHTYDELKTLLEKHLNGVTTEDDPFASVNKTGSDFSDEVLPENIVASPMHDKVKASDDVVAQFDALFNDK